MGSEEEYGVEPELMFIGEAVVNLRSRVDARGLRLEE